jgi:hypothetical protein
MHLGHVHGLEYVKGPDLGLGEKCRVQGEGAGCRTGRAGACGSPLDKECLGTTLETRSTGDGDQECCDEQGFRKSDERQVLSCCLERMRCCLIVSAQCCTTAGDIANFKSRIYNSLCKEVCDEM